MRGAAFSGWVKNDKQKGENVSHYAYRYPKVEYSPQLLKPAIIVGHDQDVDSLKGSMLLLEGGKRNEKT